MLEFKVRGESESGGVTDRDIFPACTKGKIMDRVQAKQGIGIREKSKTQRDCRGV